MPHYLDIDPALMAQAAASSIKTSDLYMWQVEAASELAWRLQNGSPATSDDGGASDMGSVEQENVPRAAREVSDRVSSTVSHAGDYVHLLARLPGLAIVHKPGGMMTLPYHAPQRVAMEEPICCPACGRGFVSSQHVSAWPSMNLHLCYSEEAAHVEWRAVHPEGLSCQFEYEYTMWHALRDWPDLFDACGASRVAVPAGRVRVHGPHDGLPKAHEQVAGIELPEEGHQAHESSPASPRLVAGWPSALVPTAVDEWPSAVAPTATPPPKQDVAALATPPPKQDEAERAPVHLVHRLDRGTSGLLCVAQTAAMARAIQKAWPSFTKTCECHSGPGWTLPAQALPPPHPSWEIP